MSEQDIRRVSEQIHNTNGINTEDTNVLRVLGDGNGLMRSCIFSDVYGNYVMKEHITNGPDETTVIRIHDQSDEGISSSDEVITSFSEGKLSRYIHNQHESADGWSRSLTVSLQYILDRNLYLPYIEAFLQSDSPFVVNFEMSHVFPPNEQDSILLKDQVVYPSAGLVTMYHKNNPFIRGGCFVSFSDEVQTGPFNFTDENNRNASIDIQTRIVNGYLYVLGGHAGRLIVMPKLPVDILQFMSVKQIEMNERIKKIRAKRNKDGQNDQFGLFIDPSQN